jgi:hypothetical protein
LPAAFSFVCVSSPMSLPIGVRVSSDDFLFALWIFGVLLHFTSTPLTLLRQSLDATAEWSPHASAQGSTDLSQMTLEI